MDEQNLITEVRSAKMWLDAQSSSFQEVGVRLRAIEDAYRRRIGEYAGIPVQRTESVQAAIDGAQIEPGGDLLRETRSARR
jgi:hypothetical protein